MTTQTGIIPALSVRDARAANELYRQAFGAEVINEMPAPDGKRIMHSCVRVNGAQLFVSDVCAEGSAPVTPQAFVLHLAVADADAAWKRATGAGLEVVVPLAVQFWGEKYGQLRDAFGVTWSIGGPQ